MIIFFPNSNFLSNQTKSNPNLCIVWSLDEYLVFWSKVSPRSISYELSTYTYCFSLTSVGINFSSTQTSTLYPIRSLKTQTSTLHFRTLLSNLVCLLSTSYFCLYLILLTLDLVPQSLPHTSSLYFQAYFLPEGLLSYHSSWSHVFRLDWLGSDIPKKFNFTSILQSEFKYINNFQTRLH